MRHNHKPLTIIEDKIESREIVNYPNYTVDTFGRVWSKKSNKYLLPNIVGKGYLAVSLWNANGYKKKLIHRLVLISFEGINPDKKVVDHIDNNPKNNRLDNLHWVTQRENFLKAVHQGRWQSPKAQKGKYGCKHHKSKGVVAYNASGEIVEVYESARRAQAAGYRDVYSALSGKRKSCHGLIFKYIANSR